MKELWDIYDENKNKTGGVAERDVYEFKDGEYHIVVTAVILNSKNEILITKRAPFKKFGLMWELSSGSILKGETSLEGIIREVKEEIGIEFNKKEAMYLKEIKGGKLVPNFKDVWVFRKDINIEDLNFQEEEVIGAKWVNIDEFLKKKEHGEFIPAIDFTEEDYKKAISLKPQQYFES